MELDMITIGNRIKERRKELSLTQIDIKEKTGISSGNMSDIERGNRLPAATTLVQLSDVLQCSIDYLLTGKSLSQENTNISAQENSKLPESQLLNFFRGMPKNDQQELLMIAQLKYCRANHLMKDFTLLEYDDNDSNMH